MMHWTGFEIRWTWVCRYAVIMCLERLEKTTKDLRLAGIPAEIQTRAVPDTGQVCSVTTTQTCVTRQNSGVKIAKLEFL